MTPDVETWKNVAKGLTGVIRLDPQGREIGRTIRGGEVFTITPFERQINQQRAAEPSSDSFRNGRLVILRKSKETNDNEIESPDALTDAEITDMLRQALNVDNREKIINRINRVTSLTTLERIVEFLVVEEELVGMVPKVEQRMADLNPDTPTVKGDLPRSKPKNRMGKAVGIQ